MELPTSPNSPSRRENDSTSVARSLPRYWRLRRRIPASPTSETLSSEAARPSASRTIFAFRARARRSMPFAEIVPETRTILFLRPALRLRGACALVCGDDFLHQAVAHDVLLVERDEANAADTGEDRGRMLETGRLAGRQIDLRDVAGHHRL